MSTSIISPKFYAWDANGNPLAFGKVKTYQARSNDPKPTYKSEDGIVENTNPVILNGEGYADIYLDGSYKIVVTDSNDNERWSADPVTSNQALEWVNCIPVSYGSATVFVISGNFTTVYNVGRRVRIDNNVSEYSFSTIQSAILSGTDTVVTVTDAVIQTGVVSSCASIISFYSIPSLSFNTVDEMKASPLGVGVRATTKEFSSGTSGGADYLIADNQSVDNYVNHLLENGNVALLIVDGPVDTRKCGMGSADDSAAWQAVLNNTKIGAVDFVDKGSNYIFLSASSCTRDITITADSGVVIDCSDPSYTGNYWTQFLGSLDQIENLGSDVSKKSSQVTFASPPSLSIGDVFIIFDPVDYSWSGFRSNYYAGEFCKAIDITFNTVRLSNPLYDAYAAVAVDIYKLNPLRVNIDGLELLGNKSTSLINLSRCIDSNLSNIKSHHKNNSCISVERSYNVVIDSCPTYNEGDGGDDYGIIIGNSHTVRILNSNIYSRRHSVSIGGSGFVGAVTGRNIVVENCTLQNESKYTHNADFHGNIEDSQYVNCNIFGGAKWGGKDNGYVNCRIHPTDKGLIITSSEILGGHHYLRGCDVFVMGNPLDLIGQGVIDIGGVTNVITSDTVYDCHFEVSGGKWNGDTLGSNTILIYYRNRGTTKKVSFKIVDIDLDVNNFAEILRTDLVSGTADSNYIIIDNIATNFIGKKLVFHNGSHYLYFPHRMPVLSGIETVTTNTGESVTMGTSKNFPWIFPRTPHVSMARTNRGAIGAEYGIVAASVADKENIIPLLKNELGSNWTAAVTVDLCWTATIREV